MWREALTDSKNELYEAAWLIFAQGVSINTTQERLQDSKDKVVPLLSNILDDDTLFDSNAPGDGRAPVKALYLIGEWQVKDALPAMLEVLELAGPEGDVREAAMTAIGNLGPDILDDLISWADEKPEYSMEVADLIADINESTDASRGFFEAWIAKEDDDLDFYIDQYIRLDPGSAEAFLNERDSESPEARKLYQQKAREAKKAYKEQLEEQLAAKKAAAAEAPPVAEAAVEETPADDDADTDETADSDDEA